VCKPILSLTKTLTHEPLGKISVWNL
jgi:hypothetical protein